MAENIKNFKIDQKQIKKLKKDKILSLLGLAMKARRLSCGCDRVCDDVRRHGIPSEGQEIINKPIGIVLIACDASQNTKKRLINACTYYNIGYIITDITSDELSSKIGKTASAAVCATFDRGFVNGILKADSLNAEMFMKGSVTE